MVFHPNGKRCNAPGEPNCRVVFAADFAPDDGLRDSDGHGTLVAAIVAGVAPDARIAALDAYRSNGYYDVDVAAAFNWVIQNARTYNIVAMNLSFGGGVFGGGVCNSWYGVAFRDARHAGVVPVVGSGNHGAANGISFPACSPGAVSVGAVYDTTGEPPQFVV